MKPKWFFVFFNRMIISYKKGRIVLMISVIYSKAKLRDQNMTKIKKSVFYVFALVILAILVACSKAQPRLLPLSVDDVILAYGDSLTYGVGANPQNSYPTLLSKLIGYPVINGGKSGETTKQSLTRLPILLKKYHPSLVILCIGGNDLLRRHSKTSIISNLKKLIQMIKAANAQILLIAVPAPSLLLSAPDFYTEIANEFDIPVETALLPRLLGSNEYKSDPIHLNAQGYQMLATGIAEQLKQLGAIKAIKQSV